MRGGVMTSDGAEQRYWDELKGYIPLGEFGSVSLAVRAAAPDVWARLHPPEPEPEGEPGPSDDAYHGRGAYGGRAPSNP